MGSTAAGSAESTDGPGTSGDDAAPPGTTGTPVTAGSASASATSSDPGPDATGDATSMSSGGPPGDDTSAASDSGAETGDPARPVHLQHGSHATCTTPIWCYDTSFDDPAGGPAASVECFDAPIAPPFTLSAVHYDVGGVAAQVQQFDIEVYRWPNATPGSLVVSYSLGAAEATEGEHVFDLPEPLVIDATRFCVGVRTTASGLAGALGIAADTDSTLPGVSWASASCGVPQWTDPIGFATPEGNFCIGADIVPMQ